MTFSRLHITVFLGLATLAWAAVLWLQGARLGEEHLAPFSTVVASLVVVGLALEHALWRLPLLHGWFVQRPDLRGTWRVEIQSDWVDPKTGVRVGPIETFMEVTQTLSRLQMHLMTAESESWFIAERASPSPKGSGYQVAAVYTNQPQTHLGGVRSEIHYGALVLDSHGGAANRPTALTGEYWTGRGTKGTMVLGDRLPTSYSRYEDAKAAFRAKHAPLDGSQANAPL